MHADAGFVWADWVGKSYRERPVCHAVCFAILFQLVEVRSYTIDLRVIARGGGRQNFCICILTQVGDCFGSLDLQYFLRTHLLYIYYMFCIQIYIMFLNVILTFDDVYAF